MNFLGKAGDYLRTKLLSFKDMLAPPAHETLVARATRAVRHNRPLVLSQAIRKAKAGGREIELDSIVITRASHDGAENWPAVLYAVARSARKPSFLGTLDVLLGNGASPDRVDEKNVPPAWMAATYGDDAVGALDRLGRAGADLGFRYRGTTLLELVRSRSGVKRVTETEKCLLKHAGPAGLPACALEDMYATVVDAGKRFQWTLDAGGGRVRGAFMQAHSASQAQREKAAARAPAAAAPSFTGRK